MMAGHMPTTPTRDSGAATEEYRPSYAAGPMNWPEVKWRKRHFRSSNVSAREGGVQVIAMD